jgi:hypothetical protein
VYLGGPWTWQYYSLPSCGENISALWRHIEIDPTKSPINGHSSPWQKSRKLMRREFEADSRRRNEAVLTEIRASFDNEEAGSKSQAVAARLLSQAARPQSWHNRYKRRASRRFF